jgi:hypothetical protein
VRWPGLRLGQLLFSRAGVAVTAGAAVATAGVADRSPLYWTWRRDGRRTCDLSHGWGHNSQWRTALRRDYRTPEGDVLNVDGTLRAVHPADDSDSEELPVDRRVELLRHRCLLTPLDDPAVDVADLWPYDWTMRVRAAGGLWSVP